MSIQVGSGSSVGLGSANVTLQLAANCPSARTRPSPPQPTYREVPSLARRFRPETTPVLSHIHPPGLLPISNYNLHSFRFRSPGWTGSINQSSSTMHTKGPAPQLHDGSNLRIGIVHARWNASIIEPLLAGTKAKLLECGVKEQNIVVQSVPGSWELPIAVQRCASPISSLFCLFCRLPSSPFLLLAPLPPYTPFPMGRIASPLFLFLVLFRFLSLVITSPAPPFARPCTGEGAAPLTVCHVMVQTNSLYAASQVQSSSAGLGSSAGDLLGSSTSDLTTVPVSTTSTGPFDAIVAIGVLIKGQTMHFEYIAESVSHGLMRVSLDTGVPVIFGVLTVLNEEQAKARAGIIEGSHNHGEDWGLAAVEMGAKRKSWAAGTIE